MPRGVFSSFCLALFFGEKAKKKKKKKKTATIRNAMIITHSLPKVIIGKATQIGEYSANCSIAH